jgi:hypothetical protein
MTPAPAVAPRRFADAAEARAVLGSFLERLPALDPLVRELIGRGGEVGVLKLEVRDPAFSAVVDLGAHPLVVRFDTGEAGAVALVATAADLHAVLCGTVTVGAAITRKRVLVRGSAARLMRAMPIFLLAPYLYPQHLAALGRTDLLPPAAPPCASTTPAAAPPAATTMEAPVNALVSRLAYVAGLALGLLKTRLVRDLDLLGALAALGRGLERARPGHAEPGPRT